MRRFFWILSFIIGCSKETFKIEDVFLTYINERRKVPLVLVEDSSTCSSETSPFEIKEIIMRFQNLQALEKELALDVIKYIVDSCSACFEERYKEICIEKRLDNSLKIILISRMPKLLKKEFTAFGELGFKCMDLMLAFDLTGSMGAVLQKVNDQAVDLVNKLYDLVYDTRVGIVYFSDYPGYYSGCGYAQTYGSNNDIPYHLLLKLSDIYERKDVIIKHLKSVRDSFASHFLSGNDPPENYARILREMIEDHNIIWREDCKKFVIMWVDYLPHACDLADTLRPIYYRTGADPGRDMKVGTDDDVLFYPTLKMLNKKGIVPIIIVMTRDNQVIEFWKYAMSDSLGNGIVIRGEDKDVVRLVENALYSVSGR